MITMLVGACARDSGQLTETAATSQALTQDQVLVTGGACTPTGAHGRHAFTACGTCHACAGVLQFDPSGRAVAAGQPAPEFDATSKTCSNVACHAVPPGTFSYYFPGGDGEPVLNTVPYGGGSATTTPGWYTTGVACGSCHRMPASPYTWHSGNHGSSDLANACQTCHQDATGFTDSSGAVTGAAIVTTSTCGPSRNEPCSFFHGNGTVDVNPRFTSGCFGCH